MSAVAALAMYDAPAAQPANDAFWAELVPQLRRAGFDDVPEQLTRGQSPEAVWTDPSLLLAQTCGYPLMTSLRRRVRLVSTPVYRAPGCDGPMHRTAVLVACDHPALCLAELRGGRCAINDPSSNTGANLLRAEIAAVAGGARFFSEVLTTGSHAASLEAVALGAADVAGIDCVTLAHLHRDEPQLASKVRVLRWSALSPGLPLITGAATPMERLPALRHALRLALRALDPRWRELLMVESFAPLRLGSYAEVLHVEREAADRGYPELA